MLAARAPPPRETSRCSTIRSRKPSSSTGIPRSSASSVVSSNGKPYVAVRSKASLPEIAAGGDLLEQLHPTRERLREALLLRAQHLADPLAVLGQLVEPLAHLLDDDVADPPELVQADRARLLDGPADDPAQHVAAALVRGRDAVGDEERHPAAVVGEDPVRLRRRLRVAELDAALGDPVHDRLVAVGLVDGTVRHVLDDRGEPLEPHARVDVLLRQRCQRPVRMLLVLHEDEVPELEEAARTARRRAGRSPQPCSGPQSQ